MINLLVEKQKQKIKIKKWLSQKTISLKKKLVVIHAPSRWKFKELPVATWAEVINALKDKHIDVVLCGSKEDLPRNELIFNVCKLFFSCKRSFILINPLRHALYSAILLVVVLSGKYSHPS